MPAPTPKQMRLRLVALQTLERLRWGPWSGAEERRERRVAAVDSEQEAPRQRAVLVVPAAPGAAPALV